MTSKKHDFEELDAPAAAAKKLGISVATLRKYSLIVENVTGNDEYFDRTKQKARLYHKKDIEDLNAFHQLAKKNGLTLKEAARQIYAVGDATNTQKGDAKAETAAGQAQNQMMDPHQVVKLLGALQQTIASQNNAIDNLQKQLNRIEQQNQTLLKQQKQLAAPKDKEIDPKIAAMPDISGIVKNDEVKKPKTREEKRKEIERDAHKSEKEMHEEILSKAKENAEKKKANANVHRTLEDMQLPNGKKHWWQRFLNY